MTDRHEAPHARTSCCACIRACSQLGVRLGSEGRRWLLVTFWDDCVAGLHDGMADGAINPEQSARRPVAFANETVATLGSCGESSANVSACEAAKQ